MAGENQQPQLEGWDDAYVPSDQEKSDALVAHINDVVAQVRADAPGRYAAREEERRSRPRSAAEIARREKMKRLTRPLGRGAVA